MKILVKFYFTNNNVDILCMHFYTYHLSKSSMRKCVFFDNRICNVVYYHHAPYQVFLSTDFCKLILYIEEVILNNKGVVILILKVMLVTLLTEYLL